MTSVEDDHPQVRTIEEGDRGIISALSREAFGASAMDFRWGEGGRVLTVGGRVIGGLCVQHFDQVFGGRSVPAGGLAWAIVAPEARARGYGTMLAQRLSEELKGGGAAISTVNPVSFEMWRRVGYEVATARSTYEAAAADIRLAGDEDVLEMQPRAVEDLSGVTDCYRRVACSQSGLVDRSAAWWRNVIIDANEPQHLYVASDDTNVCAYVLYSRQPAAGEFEYHHIRCQDLIWCDRRGAASVMAFLAAHLPLARMVSWHGPTDEPLVSFFDQGAVRLRSRVLCMTRILDVDAALTRRGYPTGSDEEVELTVVDPLFPENDRSLRLRVANGLADVAPATGKTSPRIDIATLASVYTGWLHPRDAARLGRLDGVSDAQIAALCRLFSGARPWLGEAV